MWLIWFLGCGPHLLWERLLMALVSLYLSFMCTISLSLSQSQSLSHSISLFFYPIPHLLIYAHLSFSSSFFLVHISFSFSVFLCLCLFNWVSFRLLSYVSFSSLFFWLWSRNKVESASNLFRCTFEAQCKLFFMAKSSSWFIGMPLIYCYSSFSFVFVFDVVK